MIHIEYIDNVLNHKNFNSNNHEKDPNDIEIKNLDYKTELSKTYLSKYMDLINYPLEWTYHLTMAESKLLAKICEIGILVTRRPKIYDDELEEIERRLKDNWIDGQWFMRMNQSSPKDSSVKLPYKSASDVINAIITSKRSFKAISDDIDRNILPVLYFVRYDPNWQIGREMRCFVRNRKLTAVSQYEWFKYKFFCDRTESELITIAKNVNTFIASVIDELCERCGTNDVVADIYLNDDLTHGDSAGSDEHCSSDRQSLKIIELNSFGYWLASGSALFHWIIDKDKLYNTNGDIYFRILKKSSEKKLMI
jgi:hypothetical protein